MSLMKHLMAALRPNPQALMDASLPAETSVESIDRSAMELWMGRIAASLQEFDLWLAQERDTEDYWPAFGEFLRTALNEICGAARVTPYRIADNGRELLALRQASPLVQTDRISARKGIIGHVVTTGRPYVAGAAAQRDMIDSLARDAEHPLAWCFLAQQDAQRMGVVAVGQVATASPIMLSLAERLTSQFWYMAAQAHRIRTMEQSDPVCGLLSRPAFLLTAEKAVAESYQNNAPLAVAVLALEGIRGMNDSGRWEVADDLLREVSKFLRTKVRSDDRLGRFDGSRFAILLRSVDSELATLIVRQLIAQLSTLVGDAGRWGANIKVRCGLAGSGTGRPMLRELITRALTESQRAREQSRMVSSDIIEPAMQESLA